MCAPSVIETVKRTVSRRQVLGAMSAAPLGAACGGAPAETPPEAQPETGRPRPYDQLFDLTHVLTMSMPVYPGLTCPQMTQT